MFRTIAIILALVAFPLSSSAKPEKHARQFLGSNTIALETASLSFTVGGSGKLLWGYGTLLFKVKFTHAADGTLTLTCVDVDGTDDYTISSCSDADGTCNLKDSGVFVTSSLTADKSFAFRMSIRGYGYDDGIKCTWAHGGTPVEGDIAVTRVYAIAE